MDAKRIPSDGELLDAIGQGSEESAEELCNKHDHELFLVIISFLTRNGCCQPHDHAEGVKTNAWINIFRYLSRLDDVNKFTAWRDEIARNEAKNHLRKCISTQNSFLDLKDGTSLPDGRIADLGKVAEDAEQADQLLEDAESISPKLALIIRLRYVEEYSWDEIAAQLGMSATALRSFYHRGVIKLRKKSGGRGG